MNGGVSGEIERAASDCGGRMAEGESSLCADCDGACGAAGEMRDVCREVRA